jgi:ATP-dependent Clp protease adaptor protein ClpS
MLGIGDIIQDIRMDDDTDPEAPDGPGGPDAPAPNGPAREEEHETGIMLKTRPKTKKPSMYKVLLLNDDYTPMEFVVHILEQFFGITSQQATDIMLTVHRKGLAVVGVFSFEIAETKVTQVMDYARRNQHPLQCTMEKE